MVSTALYSSLIALIALQRLSELLLSRRNRAWAIEHGALEFGRDQLLPLKALHTAFLCGCLLEVWWASRPFSPALGWPCLVLATGCQALRYWTMESLGRRWNVSILVLPQMPLETGGPYRFLRHPNYLAVMVEGLAIPLIHSAWLTALSFTLLNTPLLAARIRCEESAFRAHAGAPDLRARRPGPARLFGLLGTQRRPGVRTSR